MIVKALLSIIFGILNTLFSLINFPDVPDSWSDTIADVFSYFEKPVEFLIWMVGGKEFFVGAVTLFVLVSNADRIYHFFMWVLRKIWGS